MIKNIYALCSMLYALCFLAACDLQPKIAALPDSVGDFISQRYPTLLADPETQPDIYNSAATDYGVYASPELYGAPANVDDYLQYASVNDYTRPPQPTVLITESGGQAVIQPPAPAEPAPAPPAPSDYLKIPEREKLVTAPAEITVAKGDTLYSLANAHRTTVAELAKMNKLSPPYALAVVQKLKVPVLKKVPAETPAPAAQPAAAAIAATPVKAKVTEITVGPGDTLYSISRKVSTPVNDLAVMNQLTPPFALGVGQKLKVPSITDVATPDKTIVQVRAATPAGVSAVPKPPAMPSPTMPGVPPQTALPSAPPQGGGNKLTPAPAAIPQPKMSSAPTAPLPQIASRSSSKFSWPVRGTIVSGFGAKSNGLFNDGINIGAPAGTAVAASENGVVAYAGNELKGMGDLVILQHSDGWMTVYAHMDTLAVRRGVKVTVGQKIGTVGQTGKVDKPQLHFEIRKGTKAYDPAAYLKK